MPPATAGRNTFGIQSIDDRLKRHSVCASGNDSVEDLQFFRVSFETLSVFSKPLPIEKLTRPLQAMAFLHGQCGAFVRARINALSYSAIASSIERRSFASSVSPLPVPSPLRISMLRSASFRRGDPRRGPGDSSERGGVVNTQAPRLPPDQTEAIPGEHDEVPHAPLQIVCPKKKPSCSSFATA